jgi:hypothetical protein
MNAAYHRRAVPRDLWGLRFCWQLGRVAGVSDNPGEPLRLEQLMQQLPARIWYLTSSGSDMWCRRPYGFFFSSGESAEAFARSLGTGGELFAVGMESTAVVSDAVLAGLRDNAVTRIFIDPAVDPASGDVFGKILRLASLD